MVVDTRDDEAIVAWGLPATRTRGGGVRWKSGMCGHREWSSSALCSQVPAELEASGVDHDNGAPSLPDQLLHTGPEVEPAGPGPNFGTEDQEVWWRFCDVLQYPFLG